VFTARYELDPEIQFGLILVLDAFKNDRGAWTWCCPDLPVYLSTSCSTIAIHHSMSLTSSLSGCWNFTTGLFRDGSRTPVSHSSCSIRARITARDPHFSPFLPCSAMLENSQAATPLPYWSQPLTTHSAGTAVLLCTSSPPPTRAHRGESPAFLSHDLEVPHSNFNNQTNYSKRRIP